MARIYVSAGLRAFREALEQNILYGGSTGLRGVK